MNFQTQSVFNIPLRVTAANFCDDFCQGKTKMMWQTDVQWHSHILLLHTKPSSRNDHCACSHPLLCHSNAIRSLPPSCTYPGIKEMHHSVTLSTAVASSLPDVMDHTHTIHSAAAVDCLARRRNSTILLFTFYRSYRRHGTWPPPPPTAHSRYSTKRYQQPATMWTVCWNGQ